MKGAEAIAEWLSNAGVDVVFAYPGAVMMPLYYALKDNGVGTVLVRNERAAAHSADGYARAKKGMGACMATSGPGATNLVTGLATANADSTPLLAITVNVPDCKRGTNCFQELDLQSIAAEVSNGFNYVGTASQLAGALGNASAVLEKAGGVFWLDVAANVLTESMRETFKAKPPGRLARKTQAVLQSQAAPQDFLKEFASMVSDCYLSPEERKIVVSKAREVCRVLKASGENAEVVRAISNAFPDCILVAGNGLHKYWACTQFDFNNDNMLVCSAQFGCMGFSLPAAIGAQVARPEKQVCLVTGDGDLQMNVQELATLAEYNLPVRLFVLNNACLGSIAQLEEKTGRKAFFSRFEKPVDFARVAEAYGITALKATPSQARAAVEFAKTLQSPCLVDFTVPVEYLDFGEEALAKAKAITSSLWL